MARARNKACQWSLPVVAVKAYLGHTIAPASADQLAAALGSFKYGILPGIPTIDAVADDVHQDRLKLGPDHIQTVPENLEVAILNSKGFGGNNASAVVLSPERTEAMLRKRHGDEAMAAYTKKRETSLEASDRYISAADRGEYAPIYRFGEDMIDEAGIDINETRISIKGFARDISLPIDNPYQDMTD